MTDLTSNHDLFVDVLAHIESHPDQWNQRRWYETSECGTAACFAGWACLLSGLDIKDDDEYASVVATPHGDVFVSSMAARLLGIPATHALLDADTPGTLFFALNELEELYRISAEHLGVDIDVLKDKVRDRANAQ